MGRTMISWGRMVFWLLPATLLIATIAPAQAQRTTPLTIIVPFAAGAGTDLIARALAPSLSETLARPVIVENRAGADGIIGAVAAAHAKPDGSTIFLTSNSTHAANPSLKINLPYDPINDFAPIARIVRTYQVLVTRPTFADPSLQGIIEQAKQKPGTMTYAAGNTTSRIAAELLKLTSGIDVQYVPYKGNSQALTDVVAGHIDIMFPDTGTAQAFIAGGQVKAVAITSDKRLSLLPNVPTIVELNHPELQIGGWAAIFAPAHTPQEEIANLNAAIGKAMKSPEALRLFETSGVVPEFSSPQELALFVDSEIKKWAKVIEAAHIERE
jgi:tripartite-type tricarboxylate transporter receptor subunit TctC